MHNLRPLKRHPALINIQGMTVHVGSQFFVLRIHLQQHFSRMPTQELKLVVQWKCSLGSTTEQQQGHRKLCISIPHLDIYVDIKVCFFSFVGDIFLKKKIYERYYIYWILGVKKLPKKSVLTPWPVRLILFTSTLAFVSLSLVWLRAVC